MLRHRLGGNYFRIDDLATPDQSKDISKLDRVSKAAIDVLTSRTQAARRALVTPCLPLSNHTLRPLPLFFHGPNKNA